MEFKKLLLVQPIIHAQNYNLAVSTLNDIMKFGAGGQYATSYWNGSMSYVAFVDGTQELPGIFGETDATTGEWEITSSNYS